MKNFSIIVAADLRDGIGKEGKLPWYFQKDMAHFKQTTTASALGKQNMVILGRKTWESIPSGRRPLSDRFTCVLSRQQGPIKEHKTIVARDLDLALYLADEPFIDKVFVAGGAEVYREAIAHPLCSEIILTRIYLQADCDAFFPEINEEQFKVKERTYIDEDGVTLKFLTYVRR